MVHMIDSERGILAVLWYIVHQGPNPPHHLRSTIYGVDTMIFPMLSRCKEEYDAQKA